MSDIALVIWKDEGDFGFISTLSQADLDYRAANPGDHGRVPFDPNRVRQTGTLAEARQLAERHGAEVEVS